MEKNIHWEKELNATQSRAQAETKNILLFFHNPN
jgi:hypothetical protein